MIDLKIILQIVDWLTNWQTDRRTENVTDGRKIIEGEIADRLNHTHTQNANII